MHAGAGEGLDEDAEKHAAVERRARHNGVGDLGRAGKHRSYGRLDDEYEDAPDDDAAEHAAALKLQKLLRVRRWRARPAPLNPDESAQLAAPDPDESARLAAPVPVSSMHTVLLDDDDEDDKQTGGASPGGATSSSTPPVRSLRFIAITTLPMYGIGLAWACQYAKVTAILQVLGLAESMIPIAWLAGPISGIAVQPIIGSLSDRTVSCCGRRRYWMWAGAIGLAISMLLMMYCPEVGRLLGDHQGPQPVALTIAIVSFWTADFFLNALQGPARTLLVDVVPPTQQALGNGLFSLWDSLGKISGFLLGSLKAERLMPLLYNEYGGELFANVRLTFTISILALFLTQGINQAIIVEPPLTAQAIARKPHGFALANALRSIPGMPLQVRAVFAALFGLFFAWFTTWMYFPAFMGVDIYGGDPHAPKGGLLAKYNDGVRANSLGMMAASGLTLVLAPLLPLVARADRVGEGLTWLILEVVHILALLVAASTTSPSVATACVAVFGVPFAAFLVIPYSIVGRAAAQTESRGAYMATMNLFLCIPELLVSFVLGPIVAASGGSLRAPLYISACATALGGCVIARYLLGPRPNSTLVVPRSAPGTPALTSTPGAPQTSPVRAVLEEGIGTEMSGSQGLPAASGAAAGRAAADHASLESASSGWLSSQLEVWAGDAPVSPMDNEAIGAAGILCRPSLGAADCQADSFAGLPASTLRSAPS